MKSLVNTLDEAKRIIEGTSFATAARTYFGKKLIARTMSPEDVSILGMTPEIQKLVVAGAIASWAATSMPTHSTLRKSLVQEYSKLLQKTKKRLLKISHTKS